MVLTPRKSERSSGTFEIGDTAGNWLAARSSPRIGRNMSN